MDGLKKIATHQSASSELRELLNSMFGELSMRTSVTKEEWILALLESPLEFIEVRLKMFGLN